MPLESISETGAQPSNHTFNLVSSPRPFTKLLTEREGCPCLEITRCQFVVTNYSALRRIISAQSARDCSRLARISSERASQRARPNASLRTPVSGRTLFPHAGFYRWRLPCRCRSIGSSAMKTGIFGRLATKIGSPRDGRWREVWTGFAEECSSFPVAG